jgi:C-terminal processing protease CtpA/Prc
MMKASGWPGARLLARREAEELKNLVADRTTERGVIGLKLERWPIVDVVPDAPAATAGLQKDDVIVAVNDQDVGGSRTTADAIKLLQGPSGETVRIRVNRGGKTLLFEVKRIPAAVASVSARAASTNVLLVRSPTFEGSSQRKRGTSVCRMENPHRGVARTFCGSWR